jgi:putative ABC transport system substrate-binding protein
MRKNLFCLALCAMLFALCSSAQAQQPTKIPRIGYLGGSSPSASATSARIEALRQGLRELGYVEGKNIIIEWRHHEGKLDRLPALAAELVRLKVDIMITVGPPAARAAKEATVTIPIVMMAVGDPVASGFVASLARPGGNITGFSSLAPELSGKRLELLREIVPNLSRVAVFGTSTSPDNAPSLREVELTAVALKVKLQYLDIRDSRDPKDIETAFRAASKGRAEAVLMMVAPAVASGRRTQILDLAVKSRLPVIYSGLGMVEVGGLMTYGVSVRDSDRRAATYVDKILKGAKPADLPVEQPTKFELIINLKAAKQIGLTIPPNLLARADRVIK